MLVLEGNRLWNKGVAVGPLELTEGQHSDTFVICEAGAGTLKDVATSATDRRRVRLLTEGKKPRVLKVLEGTFQRADTVNANNRIYPDAIWKRVLGEDGKWLKSVKDGQMLGEADHPKDGETSLNRVACVVTDLYRSESDHKEIRGRVAILDTAAGRNLASIHEGGGALGVSSRGTGSVVRLDGKDVVQDDYDPATWDVVHNPSTPGAYPQEVEESSSTPAPKILESTTSATPPMTRASLLERVFSLPLTAKTPADALTEARAAYRTQYSVEGPLSVEESDAIALRVHAAVSQTAAIGSGPVSARIQFRTGPLTEATSTLTLRAQDVPSLRKLIDERIGTIRGVVEVEIDRTEEVYEVCTQRFGTLLAAQAKELSEASARATAAEKALEATRSATTDMSAKLSTAKALLEQFAQRVKAAEDQSADLAETEAAAERLIEAISVEFREEGLKAAIAAVSATHPEIADLSEALSRCNSISEVVDVTKRQKTQSATIFDREPMGLRENRVQSAIRKTQEEETRLLTESSKEKSVDPVLATTMKVVTTLQERGLK